MHKHIGIFFISIEIIVIDGAQIDVTAPHSSPEHPPSIDNLNKTDSFPF